MVSAVLVIPVVSPLPVLSPVEDYINRAQLRLNLQDIYYVAGPVVVKEK